MNDTQCLVSTPNERKYWSQIPHIAGDDLDVYEHRLYVEYIKVCGMSSGACDKTNRQLADACKMSLPKVIDARRELIDKGYILCLQEGFMDRPGEHGQPFIIAIADKWPENMER